jgi:hypothetical protein
MTATAIAAVAIAFLTAVEHVLTSAHTDTRSPSVTPPIDPVRTLVEGEKRIYHD